MAVHYSIRDKAREMYRQDCSIYFIEQTLDIKCTPSIIPCWMRELREVEKPKKARKRKAQRIKKHYPGVIEKRAMLAAVEKRKKREAIQKLAAVIQPQIDRIVKGRKSAEQRFLYG